jgi:hypothetical protein
LVHANGLETFNFIPFSLAPIAPTSLEKTLTSIRNMGTAAALDRKFTLDEAKAIVVKAKENGIVSKAEKADVAAIISQYSSQFDAGALDVLKALIEPSYPQPLPIGNATNLAPGNTERPVFLNTQGVFSVNANGTAPSNIAETGEALFRAAEAADGSRGPMLKDVSKDTRAKTFEQLKVAIAKVPADAAAPAGLDKNQALQMRASAASVLLDLINATPEAELRGPMVKTFESLVKAETNVQLKENLSFHLSNSAAAQLPDVKPIADTLLKTMTPTAPPYEKWFAGGNKTVNLAWTVGQGEFLTGFNNFLKQNGFKEQGPAVGGVQKFETTINKPGVGDTKFVISVREGGTNILAPMNDKDVQIVGYDGHSNWGRNMTSSVKNGPESADGADGKLLFYNLCVGKGVLDKVKEKYGNAQVVTTYAASNFYTDSAGQMTRGEGGQALIALVKGISERADWNKLHQTMNAAADIGHGRTWDNYITPISTSTREKVLDRDNDGQADYLDKHFNYSTFKVPEDTAREFSPVKQDRPSSVLDGTKVLVAANMVNTLSEFSGILDKYNPDSKVVAGGWYEPKAGEPKDVIRFSEQPGRNGKTEVVMTVNARYSHMSEEALRATTAFEFNRWLADSGKLRMPTENAKLGGVMAFAQSLSVDEGYRDTEVFSNFLKRYNLPTDISLSMVQQALGAHTGHNYAGDQAGIEKLKTLISPSALAYLQKPECGAPITVL